MGLPAAIKMATIDVWQGLTLLLSLSLLAPVKANDYCIGGGGFCPDGYSCHSPGVGEYCPDGSDECCFLDPEETSYTIWFVLGACSIGLFVCGCFFRCWRMHHRRQCHTIVTHAAVTHTMAPAYANVGPAPGYSQMPPQPVPPPPVVAGLPQNWKSFVDASTGKTYFQRPDGSTTWQMDGNQKLLG